MYNYTVLISEHVESGETHFR